MLNEEFCGFLEYHLSTSFKYSSDESIRSFWCDGVMLPSNENNYSKKSIDDNRKVLLKAFIGKDGQDEFALLLKFGDQALSKYARDLDIMDCIREVEKYDWYTVDKERKQIIILLY